MWFRVTQTLRGRWPPGGNVVLGLTFSCSGLSAMSHCLFHSCSMQKSLFSWALTCRLKGCIECNLWCPAVWLFIFSAKGLESSCLAMETRVLVWCCLRTECGAIPDKTGNWNTGVECKPVINIMVSLRTTSVFLVWVLLHPWETVFYMWSIRTRVQQSQVIGISTLQWACVRKVTDINVKQHYW
jgi:hypothetical protein